jgi:hypothetical protein
LDEDLFTELDEICRGNQLAYQPISRGRNAGGYVMEKYPELLPLIEIDRLRRIDSMKVGYNSETASLTFPARKHSLRSPVQHNKLTSEIPVLGPKPSAGDLIFHMDDENLSSGLGIDVGVQNCHDPGAWSNVPHDPPHVDKAFSSDSVTLSTKLQSQSKDVHGPTALVSLSVGSVSKAPWGSVGPSNSPSNFKDIMAESRLSTFPDSPNVRETSTRGNFTAKLSQKQRKKLKQQQMQEFVAEQESSKSSPPSPWHMTGRKWKETPIPDKQLAHASVPARPSSKAAMTLRQTVAGTSSPHNVIPARSWSQTQPGTAQVNSPAYPTKTDSLSHARILDRSSSPTSRTAQLRHPNCQAEGIRAAKVSSPSSHQLSLASILRQQQFEKEEIRAAATAKHSLHDIQLEQEFQEWWDQESKRVMKEAEEAEAATSEANPKRATRGRGGIGRGKSKGPPFHQRHAGEGCSGAPDGRLSRQPASADEKLGDETRNFEGLRGRAHNRGRGSGRWKGEKGAS